MARRVPEERRHPRDRGSMDVGLGCALAALLIPAPGRAGEPVVPILLEWSGPAGCAPKDEVVARAMALNVPFADDADPEAVVVRGRVDDDPPALDLSVLSAGGEALGERRVDADGCDELVEAAAVLLSVAASGRPPSAAPDPGAAAPQLPVPDPVAPAPPTAPDPEPAPPPASPPAGGEDPPLVGIVAAALLVDVGMLPGPSLGVRALGGLAENRWELTAAAQWIGPDEDPVPGTAASTRYWSAALRVDACGRGWMIDRIELLGCGLVEAGAIRGEGRGLAVNQSGRNPWIAVGVAGAGRVALGDGLGVELRIDAVVPVHRPDFVLEVIPGQPQTVHRSGAVVGRFGAALIWSSR